ncbi:MAG TPA: hypothetical protein VN731_07045 [Rhodanobacter sp.]|nr:hypothetical protein [Rhodanobacter sp.]
MALDGHCTSHEQWRGSKIILPSTYAGLFLCPEYAFFLSLSGQFSQLIAMTDLPGSAFCRLSKITQVLNH